LCGGGRIAGIEHQPTRLAVASMVEEIEDRVVHGRAIVQELDPSRSGRKARRTHSNLAVFPIE
jgi:hypothetical protein